MNEAVTGAKKLARVTALVSLGENTWKKIYMNIYILEVKIDNDLKSREKYMMEIKKHKMKSGA